MSTRESTRMQRSAQLCICGSARTGSNARLRFEIARVRFSGRGRAKSGEQRSIEGSDTSRGRRACIKFTWESAHYTACYHDQRLDKILLMATGYDCATSVDQSSLSMLCNHHFRCAALGQEFCLADG